MPNPIYQIDQIATKPYCVKTRAHSDSEIK
jgi:hypothetical protein